MPAGMGRGSFGLRDIFGLPTTNPMCDWGTCGAPGVGSGFTSTEVATLGRLVLTGIGAGVQTGLMGAAILLHVLMMESDAAPKAVRERIKAKPEAKPQPQPKQSGKQTKCWNTGIDWQLGFCTYACDDGLPDVTPIPAGNRCESVIYRDWRTR